MTEASKIEVRRYYVSSRSSPGLPRFPIERSHNLDSTGFLPFRSAFCCGVGWILHCVRPVKMSINNAGIAGNYIYTHDQAQTVCSKYHEQQA
jgi:hypothetical protein